MVNHLFDDEARLRDVFGTLSSKPEFPGSLVFLPSVTSPQYSLAPVPADSKGTQQTERISVMSRLLLSSLTLTASLLLASSTLISVRRGREGQWEVEGGRREDWVVVANMTDRREEEGWLHLDLTSRDTQPDQEQAVAAGLAEGYLSHHLILSYYQHFIQEGLCQVDRAFCAFIRQQFQANLDWVRSKVETEGRTSSYWKMVDLFHKQLEGLKLGWLKRAEDDNLTIPPDFDIDWFVYFINFYPDIGDYIPKYKKYKESQAAGLVFSAPSCSVLIKKVGEEVLVGHATWHVFESLSYKMVKRYNLNYHTAAGDIVPGHTIAMSSYAGNIFSLDDLYSTSAGLAVLETTLFVYNSSLLEENTAVGQVWEPVRVMVANRLGREGREWSELFSQYNSGTYNNQWMVLDYNKVRAGIARDVLWVTEQLPGKIVSRDVTEILESERYWASYNRAYFPEIFQLSGGEEMERRYGDWFSRHNTPRALLFSQGQEAVRDEASMMSLLRSNTYSTSPHSSPQGCNGKVPAAAIAARSDLQPSNVSCSWQSHDFMVGRRAYGATDAKVMSSSSARSLSFRAVSGPSTAEGTLPPFSWERSGLKVPEYKFTDTFQFPDIEVNWNQQHQSDIVKEQNTSNVVIPSSILVTALSFFSKLL